MHRLYLRIYLAVLASLAAFALVSGALWRQLGDGGPATRSRLPARSRRMSCRPPMRRAPSSRRR